MKIIDPHVHIWTHDPEFPWPAETRNPPSGSALPEELLALMEANGVEKTVLIQSIHYRWDNSFVAHVQKSYPNKFMGVCRVNPEDQGAPDHLSFWTEEHGFKGVRLSPSIEPSGDWFDGPLMAPLFARSEALKIPMLILTGPKRLPRLAQLIEQFPELDVVIDHMADCSPNDSEQVQALLNLARYPRVYVKISHTWGISNEVYPWKDTHGLVRQVYEVFGARRIMWDTDWPVCLHKATYGQTLTVVRDEMNFFSSEDLEWVLGKTALRLWPFD